MAVIFSLLFWAFMLVTSALLYPFALMIRILSGPFDPRLVILHRFSCFWASLYTWCNPLWRLRIEGNIDPRGTYVMVCNHQSLVDILVLFRLFVHFKWVSKAENFRIPFVGWNMTLNRYVRIERGKLKGSLQMMRDAEAALRAGNSVMIFPEGTRSPDGNLQPFAKGAFELAIRTGCPVLPIVVDGTAAALPKRGFVLRGRQTIRLRTLEPISSSAAADAAGLTAMTHGEIARALEHMRGRDAERES